MQFRLLGPLEVEDNGRPIHLGSAKQRTLLAILLVHANEVVSRDRLIDELWGERPPPSAAHSLEVYVSRLRKALPGSNGRDLVTKPGGYVLSVEPDQLDVTRFERLVDGGRRALASGDYSRASQQMADALALWRGPALADLAYEPAAAGEAERLEEHRLTAVEDRIDADLALGRHASLIGELEALSNKQPLRERLHGQLMLALYRSGRQAEALEAYRETRQLLLEELGIDPSPALQRLEQSILRQDPALELAPQQLVVEDGRPPTKPQASRRKEFLIGRWRRVATVVAITGLVLADVSIALVVWMDNPEASLGRVDANTIGIVDPKNGAITHEIPVGGAPADLAFGAGSIWAVSANRQNVSRINSQTGNLMDTIPVGHGASGVAYGGGYVWVANSLDGTVSWIDPRTRRVVDDIAVGNVPVAL